MAFPLSRLRRDGGEVEPGPFERPTETYVALVHHRDDGGYHLGVRAGVLGDRIHEIEFENEELAA